MELVTAIEDENWELAQRLIFTSPYINAFEQNGLTPLHHFATKSYDERILRAFLSVNADINIETRDGTYNTPLHIAIGERQIQCVKALIKAGANVNAVDADGSTPLHELANRINSEKLARLLIERNADLNAVENYGNTPLHIACCAERWAVAKELIEQDADVTIIDGDEDDALCILLESNHPNEEIFSLLIDAGIELNYANSVSIPLHIACRKSHLHFVKLLINEKADVNLRNDDNETPLMAAIHKKGDIEIVKALLAAGADETVIDDYKRTLLHKACMFGLNDIIYLLLQRRNVNLANISTCLTELLLQRDHLASNENVTLLLDKGADPNCLLLSQRDHLTNNETLLLNKGINPNCLFLAAFQGNDEVMITLIQHGACNDLRICFNNITQEITRKALVLNFPEYPQIFTFQFSDFVLLNPTKRQQIFTLMLLWKSTILQQLAIELLEVIFGYL